MTRTATTPERPASPTPTEPVYTPHPCAELFPLMSHEQEADFIADIKRNGLREPIIIDQHNRIVDGIHRYRACIKLGIKPKFERRNLTNEEAWALGVSRNLHRRHLSEGTRAAISAETRAANLPVTQAEAAKAFNISERTQRSAEAVLAASPDLHRAVKNDELSVHAAEKIARLPAVERAAAIDKVKQGDAKGARALAKAAATSQVKMASTVRKNGPPARPKASARKFRGSAVYAPLFAELDQLADQLAAHPLSRDQAQQLITELHRAIERIERIECAMNSAS